MPNWPSEPPRTGVNTYIIDYHIWFANVADYDAAVATFGGNMVARGPSYMRAALGIAENAVPWDSTEDTWIQFNLGPGPAPVIHNFDGTWHAPLNNQEAHYVVFPSHNGDSFYWPNSSYTLDYTQDWFTWPGSPAITLAPAWPAGRLNVFIWNAVLLSKTGSVASTPTTITPAPGEPSIVRQAIRPRRFSQGFETQNGGQIPPNNSPEGLSGTTQSEGYARSASRTPDGIGYLSYSSGSSCRMFLNDNGAPSNARNSHERIYIKFQKFPTTATRFLTLNDDSNETMNPTIDQNGQLNGFTVNNFIINSGPLGAGSILQLNTWYRFDIYVKFYRTGSGADCRLIIKILGDTVLDITGTVFTGFGPGSRNHSDTTVSSSGNGLEVCYDDWENIDPGPTGDDATVGPDLQEGTIDYWTGVHMQLIRNTGFAANTNWTGEFLASMQKQPATPLVNITSSTSGALLALTTDMNGLSIDDKLGFVRQQGTICLNAMCSVSKGVGSTTDKIGVQYGANTVDVTKTMGVTLDSYHTLVNVSAGLTDPMPPDLSEPALVRFTKSTDANATTVVFLGLEATFMGQYGPEDGVVPDEFQIATDLIGYHNAPYFATFLGRATTPPTNSVQVASGTYVGNGTSKVLNLPLFGVHWLVIRNTATHQKTWWWSTHLGPHLEVIGDSIRPGLMINADIKDDGTTDLSLVNNNNASNASGVTYQYVAFSDPMSRVNMNVPYRQNSAGGSPTPLFNGTYLPEFAMVQAESVKNNSGAVNMYTKGAGFTANQAKNSTNVSPSATGMQFAAGSVTELATIANAEYTQSMALWRQYPDGDSAKPRVTYVGQYTGNGAGGTRNITVSLNGSRPLFAMVIPLDNSTPFMRDPGHTGLNSTVIGGTSTLTTGITGGGVDTIQVGTALNTNLIVYSVFIIPACTADAGNGGWGVNGVCALAESGWDDPPDYFLTPPDPPADVTMVGSGGIVLSGETSKLIVEQMSGIYTLIPGQIHDTLITGTPTTEADAEIPDPNFKTGFIGG